VGKYIMPKILFAVDENNYPKILKVELYDDEHFEIPSEDIEEIESNILAEGEDYSLGVYKGSLTWIDDTKHYPEYEVDGYWTISDDFELIANLESEL
jgi:hypothetical protein